MSLKIFIAILFLFSFVFTSVSHAEESILKKTGNGEDAVKILSGRCAEKDSTKKADSLKDKHLNRHLAMLEKCIEQKLDNKGFDDICKRYIGLIRQYGEAGRAINFFNGLAERHPQSQNVLAVSGSITHDLRKKT